MLNAIVLDTKAFLEWIAGTRKVDVRRTSTSVLRKAVAAEFCAVTFRDGSGTSPTDGVVVVVDPKRLREFFAFVSTYVVDHVPFSAFFRVISADNLDLLAESPKVAAERDGKISAKDLVGIPIAEAAIHLRSRQVGDEVRPISLGAVNATYSMSVLQGVARDRKGDLEEIGIRWAALRSALGGEQLPLSTEDLVGFWKLVGAALWSDVGQSGSEANTLVSVLGQAAALRAITDDMVADLSAQIPELDGRRLRLSGTREDRARIVRDVLDLMGKSSRRKGHLEACMAGCLLSLLGDGSLKFLPSSLSSAVTPSLTPLWFALWCGLQPNNDVMTRFNCLGRRIARDLSVPVDLYDPPTEDLGMDELLVLGSNVESLIRSQSGTITVEIQPGISTRQGLLKSPGAASEQRPPFQDELRELRSLIGRSSEIVEQMEGERAGKRGVAPYRRKPKTGLGSMRSR